MSSTPGFPILSLKAFKPPTQPVWSKYYLVFFLDSEFLLGRWKCSGSKASRSPSSANYPSSVSFAVSVFSKIKVLTLFVIRLKHVTHPLLGNGGPLPLSLRRLFLFHFFFQALLSYGHQLTHTHRCEPFLLYLFAGSGHPLGSSSRGPGSRPSHLRLLFSPLSPSDGRSVSEHLNDFQGISISSSRCSSIRPKEALSILLVLWYQFIFGYPKLMYLMSGAKSFYDQ
jgi:hypothetical protein